MSQPSDDNEDKPYEASRRKLEEARKKGEIVRSQDANALVSLALGTIALAILCQLIMPIMFSGFVRFLSNSVEDSQYMFSEVGKLHLQQILTPSIGVLWVFPFFLIFALLIAARQIVVTPDKLQPKMSRVSIIANAKKKYGMSGIFEFAKTVLKFSVFVALFALFLKATSRFFDPLILYNVPASLKGLYKVSLNWMIAATATYLLFAAIDVLWQAHSHAKKQRMSHKEMKDEHKNEEGDEAVRQKRRAKAEEIATNRMLLDVPKASVVVTNPTHYAVALKWEGQEASVPKCVAKGADETARKIRELAIQSGVPLFRDPPTARELYATLKIGSSIDRKHYKAVAIAIGYARRIEKMADKIEKR